MSRKQKHVKARQAAQARAARNIKQLGAYSHSNLAKTADRQLVNIAKTLGKEWERQKRQAIAEAKATSYHRHRETDKERLHVRRAHTHHRRANSGGAGGETTQTPEATAAENQCGTTENQRMEQDSSHAPTERIRPTCGRNHRHHR